MSFLTPGAGMASAYREAARVLQQVEAKRASLKQAAYATSSPKRCFALVTSVLKHRAALEGALASCGLSHALGMHIHSKRCVALLATFDVVAGKGLPRRSGGMLARCLREHASSLKSAYHQRLASEPPLSLQQLTSHKRRRFARCNPLRGATTATVLRATRGKIDFTADEHVADLLEFPPHHAALLNGTHELVVSGQVVLQDKSSCFPAQALISEAPLPPPRAILDCCAAPGNKTTHAAALLRHTDAVIYALDRDADRLALLERRVETAGATHMVKPRRADFLHIDPAHFPDVDAMLLDPSCSGSGLLDRYDSCDDDGRIRRLAAFQLAALTKVLTQFPTVSRAVYSTCSVDERENEAIVAAALAKSGGTFHLSPCIPSWPRRGRSYPGLSDSDSRSLLRVDPLNDCITGFFVALFVRSPLIGRSVNTTKRARQKCDDVDPAEDTIQSTLCAAGETTELTGESPTQNLKRKLKKRRRTKHTPTASVAHCRRRTASQS